MDRIADSGPGDAPGGHADEPSPSADSTETRLTDLAHEAAEYAQAWTRLAASEAAHARVNVLRLLLVGMLVPAMAAGVVVGADALATALLQSFLNSWRLATAIVAAANVALLLGMLWLLRAWLKSFSLPKSRAALSRLWSSP